MLAVVAVAVFFLIRAQVLERRRQVLFLKPAATLLVIGTALLSFAESSHSPTYTGGVLVGLVLSLGGDVALIFDEDQMAFKVGLILFFLAHVSYSVVFTLLGRFSGWDAITGSVLLVSGAGFYVLIRENLGKMRLPVIAYMVVISFMVSRAASTMGSARLAPQQGAMVAGGAILFYASDVILAANRFWRPWRYERVGLALYYAGQMLIALAGSYFPSGA